jgi:hypothetical protein
VVDEGIYVYLG